MVHWDSNVYRKKKFFIPYFSIFSNNITEVQSKIYKMWHMWIGWIKVLCKWHIFSMIPRLTTVLWSYYFLERKFFLMRNLTTILPLKFRLSERLQRFNAIDGNIEMLKNIWISKNFSWNEKYQNILRIPNSEPLQKHYSTSHQIKASWVSETKKFLRRYAGIQIFDFQVLQKFSSLASKNGTMQMLFVTPMELKYRRFLAVLREYIFYNVQWVEVCKMREVF